MISLYYGGLFIPGFLIDLILFIIILKSISICYINKKVENEFIGFWLLVLALVISMFNYGINQNLTALFIYFTITPILVLVYGIYIIKTYEKK